MTTIEYMNNDRDDSNMNEQSTTVNFLNKVYELIENNEGLKLEYNDVKMVILNTIDINSFSPDKLHIQKVKSLIRNILTTYNVSIKPEYKELQLDEIESNILAIILVKKMVDDLIIERILIDEYKIFQASNTIKFAISKISAFENIKSKFENNDLFYIELEKPKPVEETKQKEENHNNGSMLLRWTQKSEFEQLLKTASTLVDELTFEINGDGLGCRTMDPSHVALVDAFLPNSSFEKFECSSWIKFGLNVDETLKILQQIENGKETLQLELTKDSMIRITNLEGFEAKQRVIEASSSSTPLPKLSFNSEFVLSDKAIKTLIKRSSLGEYFTIETNNEKLIFNTKNDLGEFNQEFKTVDSKSGLELLEVKDDSKATYTIDYMVRYWKSFTSYKTNTIKFEYSSKMPLKMSVDVSGGYINFYLAPRVQDD